MIAEYPSPINLREAILYDAQTFLLKLHLGATDEELTSLLFEIRRQETELMKQEGLMLHPDVWSILFTRYFNRKVPLRTDAAN